MQKPSQIKQELANVKAGIPARDAEIETLRKENAELREQLEAIGAGGIKGKLMPGAVSAEPMIEATVCGYTPGQCLVELRLPAGWRLKGLALELGDAVIISAAPVATQPDAAQMIEPSGNSEELFVSVRDALDWYAQQVGNCRRFGPVGDAARADLDADGGRRAHAALAQQDATLHAEVLDMVRMLEANEWADHCGKSELGQRLEWAITALQNRISELTKSSSQQDADKVNADRYRWLRDKRTREELQIVLCDEGVELDAAIDAARKESGQ